MNRRSFIPLLLALPLPVSASPYAARYRMIDQLIPIGGRLIKQSHFHRVFKLDPIHTDTIVEIPSCLTYAYIIQPCCKRKVIMSYCTGCGSPVTGARTA